MMVPSQPATAQTVNHGDVEFSVMNGLGFVSSGGDNATVLMTPVPPVWRISFWTQSALTADLGFSVLIADDFTIINLESGMSANLAARDATLVPFIGGLAGLLNSNDGSDSSTDFYLGGQAGLRSFFRDYAAVRLQAGYRHVMLEGDDVGIIELVGGLSFFL
jgi:hypothetical protein